VNKLIGLVLLIAGIAACYVGWQRRESLAGGAAELGTKLANKVDGGARVPEHMYYLVGGGMAALIGAGLLLKRPS
jgi:hypothetical protein